MYMNETSLLYHHSEPWQETATCQAWLPCLVEPFSAFLYETFHDYSGEEDLNISLLLFSPKYLGECCGGVRNVTEGTDVSVSLAGKEYRVFDSGEL